MNKKQESKLVKFEETAVKVFYSTDALVESLQRLLDKHGKSKEVIDVISNCTEILESQHDRAMKKYNDLLDKLPIKDLTGDEIAEHITKHFYALESSNDKIDLINQRAYND